MEKLKILVLVGGRSGEHEISLISGGAVVRALDRSRFEPEILVIGKDGRMMSISESQLLSLPTNPKNVVTPEGPEVFLRPYRSKGAESSFFVNGKERSFHAVFPILHGPGGEDGTIQGLFEFSGIPVVGNDVKASAMCMDKIVTKRICQSYGLPVVPFVEMTKGEARPAISWAYPLFVKPATLGSSLGVSKVKNESDLWAAAESALEMDDRILIEPGIVGRELEMACLGSRASLVVSKVGEIICSGSEFYTYEAKYIDPHAAKLIFPAPMDEKKLEECKKWTAAIFRAMGCHGLARIDFFLDQAGNYLLNEVNTIPGFTPISMYPKLMELEGWSYSNLVAKLIDLAFEKKKNF